MDDNIEVKEEPMSDWERDFKQEGSPIDKSEGLAAIMGAGELEGLHQLESSSYSAAINMAYGELHVKTEEAKHQVDFEFGFVDLDVKPIESLDMDQATDVDPLQSLVLGSVKQECPLIKEEVQDKMNAPPVVTVEGALPTLTNAGQIVPSVLRKNKNEVEAITNLRSSCYTSSLFHTMVEECGGEDCSSQGRVDGRTQLSHSYHGSHLNVTSQYNEMCEGVDGDNRASCGEPWESPRSSMLGISDASEKTTSPGGDLTLVSRITLDRSMPGYKELRHEETQNDCGESSAGFMNKPAQNCDSDIKLLSVENNSRTDIFKQPHGSGTTLTTNPGHNPYVCDLCNAKFPTRNHLVVHLITHPWEKLHVCDVCNADFSRRSHLVRHIRTHYGEKPHVCDVCSARFSSKYHLVSHSRTHSGEKPYTCDVCSATFSRRMNLTVHLRTHSGEKPYVCDVCNARFSSKHHLVSHSRTHSGEKPYTCDVCSATFAHRRNLVTHISKHSGEKPYVCDVCSARFRHRNSLVRHNIKHSAEKSYVCEVCSASFSMRNSLVDHIRIHSGEKPYVCEVCSVRFSHRYSLGRHKKKHSGEKS